MNMVTDILNWTVFTVGDTVTTVRAFLTAIVVLLRNVFAGKNREESGWPHH